MPESVQGTNDSLSDVAKRIKTLERNTRLRERKPVSNAVVDAIKAAGIQFVERVEVATASGVAETGWSSYATLDLSAYVPSEAKAVLLSIFHQSTHSGGSAGDSDNRINWLVDAFAAPYEDRVNLTQALVEHLATDVTHQVTWPINTNASAQWRYYNYVSGTGTQTYTIYLDGYIA